MKQISEKEARRLLLSGQAGYWSIHPRSVPVEHDKLFVIRLRGKCWLADDTEFGVKFVGYAGVLAGRHKGAFSIECSSQEIEEMARLEMEERGVRMGSDDMLETPDGRA